MSSFWKCIRKSAILLIVGTVCSVPVMLPGPVFSEDTEAPAGASGSQNTARPAVQASGKYENLFPEEVARVNGETVTGRELEQAIRSELASIGSPEWTDLREDFRGRLVYDSIMNLVDSKLIYAEAIKSGIEVADSEVQDEFLKLAKSFESDEAMDAFLAGRNMNRERVIQDIHKSMMLSRYVDTTISSNISVTPEEISEYYSSNPDLFKHPDVVRTSHILIETGETPKENEAAKERAEELLERIKNGEDFAALARENSASPSASQGGDIGFKARDSVPPGYADAAFSLPIGESKIVKMPEGYYIVKVTDRKAAGVSALEEVEEELVQFLKNDKMQAELAKKINELRDESEIQILIPAGQPLNP